MCRFTQVIRIYSLSTLCLNKLRDEILILNKSKRTTINVLKKWLGKFDENWKCESIYNTLKAGCHRNFESI